MLASFEFFQCQRYVHSSFQMTVTFILSTYLLPSKFGDSGYEYNRPSLRTGSTRSLHTSVVHRRVHYGT